MYEAVLKAMDDGDHDAALARYQKLPESKRRSSEGRLSLIIQALYRKQEDLAAEFAGLSEARPDFLEAVALGRVDIVRGELDSHPDLLKGRSPDGFTPLHYAAYFGRSEVALLLLDHGGDPDAEARHPSRVRPLHSATAGGHIEIVRALLRAGASVDATQASGFTALMSASLHGRGDIVKTLLEAGADPVRAADDGRNSIDMAREGGHHTLGALMASHAERGERGFSR